jgi:hypothetical protein
MSISFEIPNDLEQPLRTGGADLNGRAREAFLVDLYRDDQITHHQLAEALGLRRLETEGVICEVGAFLIRVMSPLVSESPTSFASSPPCAPARSSRP